MKNLILNAIKARDQALLKKFCSRGNFMTDSGATTYVCRPVNADEVLSFLHEWDAVLLESIKGEKPTKN